MKRVRNLAPLLALSIMTITAVRAWSAANCVVTAAAGKSSASSRGCTTSADWSAVGNIMKPISSVWSNWAVSLFS
jgi:hypothetical protein